MFRGRDGLKTLKIALVSSLVTASLCGGAALADTALANRYPYDPACAWGRISDGKGMIVRCVSKREAGEVLEAAKRAREAKEQAKKDAAEKPPEKPSEKPAPPPEEKPQGKSGAVSLKFGELKVDEGSLPSEAALKSLAKGQKKMEACVQEHGGLTHDSGELRVRFLVRERGIAEGVEVERRKGMSEKAGKCVAEVIDRRRVGHPSVPITGATLELSFTRATK
ncbi:MAG: hypothetical protein AB7K71_04400 [Polyangiaceae bacterium]|mgnify:CR=1 FL=1